MFAGSTIVPITTKIGLQFSAPLVFIFFRFLFATIIFFPFFYFSSKKQKLYKDDYKKFIIVSAFLFINVTFFTIGVQFTTALMSQILYMSTPIVVGIFGNWFLQEKLTREKIVGLFIAMCGVGFLLYQSIYKQTTLTFGTFLGNSIILIGVLGYSGWILYSRSIINSKKYNSSQVAFFTFFFITLYLTILLPFQQNIAASPVHFISSRGIIDAVYVSIGSIVLYFFMQLGIKKTSAFTASLFQYLGPFFTAAVSMPILHEKPTITLIIGGLLVVLGVFYATTYPYIRKRITIHKGNVIN